MTNETKVRLLTIILNAGIKGTDREMLDNLKAVIKSIENEGCCKVLPEAPKVEVCTVEKKEEEKAILPTLKRKAGRPPKKR